MAKGIIIVILKRKENNIMENKESNDSLEKSMAQIDAEREHSQPAITYTGNGNGTMIDKYGDRYDISIKFDLGPCIPQDYLAEHKYVDYDISVTPQKKNEDEKVKTYTYLVNLPAGSLFYKFRDLLKELEIERKLNRIGDIRHGMSVMELHIDFKKHYEDMIVGMMNDFVSQFDEQPIELKKMAIDQALESHKDKSITELVGVIFENTAEIKNFLAIDNTGELKKQLEQTLNDAIRNGRIKMDIFSSLEKEIDDYER